MRWPVWTRLLRNGWSDRRLVGVGAAALAAAQGVIIWISPPVGGAVAASAALYFALLGAMDRKRKTPAEVSEANGTAGTEVQDRTAS